MVILNCSDNMEEKHIQGQNHKSDHFSLAFMKLVHSKYKSINEQIKILSCVFWCFYLGKFNHLTFLWEQDWIPNLYLTFHSPSPLCLLGGAIGGLGGYLLTRGKFKSVRQILKEMTSDQKRELFNEIRHALRGVACNSAPDLIAKVIASSSLKKKVIDVMTRKKY